MKVQESGPDAVHELENLRKMTPTFDDVRLVRELGQAGGDYRQRKGGVHFGGVNRVEKIISTKRRRQRVRCHDGPITTLIV